jgi:hypothetical protein
MERIRFTSLTLPERNRVGRKSFFRRLSRWEMWRHRSLFGQKGVPFVAGVEAHLVAHQARGDADSNRPPAGIVEYVR